MPAIGYCFFLPSSVVAINDEVLKQPLLSAKRKYEAESLHYVQLYFADSHGSLRWTDSPHKWHMRSIVLKYDE